MEPRRKIIAASCVLLGGLAVAMCFRQESAPKPSPAAPGTGDVVRRQSDTNPTTNPPAVPLAETTPARPKPTFLNPIEHRESPPFLAKDYPGTAGIDVGWDESRVQANAPRTHTIVDGDTLAALAQRYLGTADRATEIFQANRERLPSPEILPIGLEIKIPPRGRPAENPDNLMPKQPLTPVME